jgi:hypothetical protein
MDMEKNRKEVELEKGRILAMEWIVLPDYGGDTHVGIEFEIAYWECDTVNRLYRFYGVIIPIQEHVDCIAGWEPPKTVDSFFLSGNTTMAIALVRYMGTEMRPRYVFGLPVRHYRFDVEFDQMRYLPTQRKDLEKTWNWKRDGF